MQIYVCVFQTAGEPQSTGLLRSGRSKETLLQSDSWSQDCDSQAPPGPCTKCSYFLGFVVAALPAGLEVYWNLNVFSNCHSSLIPRASRQTSIIENEILLATLHAQGLAPDAWEEVFPRRGLSSEKNVSPNTSSLLSLFLSLSSQPYQVFPQASSFCE